jgi:hypothetical protein
MLLMKESFVMGSIALGVLFQATAAQSALRVNVAQPKTYGQKTILKLDLRNTFTNAIEAGRAVLFLFDDSGKVVGQETRWIIGGTKDRPPLAANARTTFNFVIQASKPFTKTKLTVTRIVLEGGKLADVSKDVQIEAPEPAAK